MQDLDELYKLILERKNNPEKGSYTDYLFTKGLDKILKKVGEEATEVVVAAKNPSDPDFILEVADLAYHVEVLMAERGITPDQIKKNLPAVKASKVSQRIANKLRSGRNGQRSRQTLGSVRA